MAEHAKKTVDVSRFTDEQASLFNAAAKLVYHEGHAVFLQASDDLSGIHFRYSSDPLVIDMILLDEGDESARTIIVHLGERPVFEAGWKSVSHADRVDVFAEVIEYEAGGWESDLLRAAAHLSPPGPMRAVAYVIDADDDD